MKHTIVSKTINGSSFCFAKTKSEAPTYPVETLAIRLARIPLLSGWISRVFSRSVCDS